MKTFLYSTYPFLLEPLFLSIQSPFSQSQFFCFGKSKSSIQVQILCVFFKMQKCVLEASYETSHTLKLWPLLKKLTAYSRKQFLQKKQHLRCLGRSKRIPALILMNPNPNINTSTISKDSMQNTSPLFNNSPTSPYNLVTENTDI